MERVQIYDLYLIIRGGFEAKIKNLPYVYI